MNRFDSVYEWWADLIESEQQLPFSHAEIDRMIWLATEYEALQADFGEAGAESVHHQSRIRSIVRQVLLHGMTTSQAARLLGTSQDQLVRELYCNQMLNDFEVQKRLIAEAVIRQRGSMAATTSASGLTRGQVSSLSAMLGVKPVNDSVTGPKPTLARDLAVAMRASGSTNLQVSAHLASIGYDIIPATISQWWHRSQKEEKN